MHRHVHLSFFLFHIEIRKKMRRMSTQKKSKAYVFSVAWAATPMKIRAMHVNVSWKAFQHQWKKNGEKASDESEMTNESKAKTEWFFFLNDAQMNVRRMIAQGTEQRINEWTASKKELFCYEFNGCKWVEKFMTFEAVWVRIHIQFRFLFSRVSSSRCSFWAFTFNFFHCRTLWVYALFPTLKNFATRTFVCEWSFSATINAFMKLPHHQNGPTMEIRRVLFAPKRMSRMRQHKMALVQSHSTMIFSPFFRHFLLFFYIESKRFVKWFCHEMVFCVVYFRISFPCALCFTHFIHSFSFCRLSLFSTSKC